MRVLNCVFLLAAFAAAASATAIDDEITKLEATLAELKVLRSAESNNNEALKFVSAAAMASSSSGSSSSSVEAGDTSDNSEYDIQPQPTRASTEAPSTESASSATASSTTSSGSVGATSSASAEASRPPLPEEQERRHPRSATCAALPRQNREPAFRPLPGATPSFFITKEYISTCLTSLLLSLLLVVFTVSLYAAGLSTFSMRACARLAVRSSSLLPLNQGKRKLELWSPRGYRKSLHHSRRSSPSRDARAPVAAASDAQCRSSNRRRRARSMSSTPILRHYADGAFSRAACSRVVDCLGTRRKQGELEKRQPFCIADPVWYEITWSYL